MSSVLLQIEDIKEELATHDDPNRIRFRQGYIAALRDITQTTFEEMTEEV